jgi:hypothetical protein
MVRDILNYLGDKIGELELPDDTPEEVWDSQLAMYAVAPPSPQEQFSEALSRTVAQSRLWADEIIEEFKKENLADFVTNSVPNDLAIMISMHVHHRLRAIDITVGGVPFTIDLMNLVISGDLETAYVVLAYMTPDDMSMPYHWLSQSRIDALRSKIATRVGL